MSRRVVLCRSTHGRLLHRQALRGQRVHDRRCVHLRYKLAKSLRPRSRGAPCQPFYSPMITASRCIFCLFHRVTEPKLCLILSVCPLCICRPCAVCGRLPGEAPRRWATGSWRCDCTRHGPRVGPCREPRRGYTGGCKLGVHPWPAGQAYARRQHSRTGKPLHLFSA